MPLSYATSGGSGGAGNYSLTAVRRAANVLHMKTTGQIIRENLTAICTRKKISQRELSRRSGVHFVTINRIFQGNQTPSTDIAAKLAGGAGTTLAKLFSDSRQNVIANRSRGR